MLFLMKSGGSSILRRTFYRCFLLLLLFVCFCFLPLLSLWELWIQRNNFLFIIFGSKIYLGTAETRVESVHTFWPSSARSKSVHPQWVAVVENGSTMMMWKGLLFRKTVFGVRVIKYVLFYICMGIEFADLISMVLPMKRDLSCVFTYDRAWSFWCDLVRLAGG